MVDGSIQMGCVIWKNELKRKKNWNDDSIEMRDGMKTAGVANDGLTLQKRYVFKWAYTLSSSAEIFSAVRL